MALSQERADFRHSAVHHAGVLGLDEGRVHRVGQGAAREAALGRSDGNDHRVVLVLPHGRLPLGGQHPHNLEGDVSDANVSP